MKVRVNGTEQEFSDADELPLAELLERLDVASTRGIAVARNLGVVPRSQWGVEVVHDGDEIEIVRATQGG